jgi:hypothetical protein
MSRTAPSLARIDTLLAELRGGVHGGPRDQMLEEAEALRRAVAAFHMEAIRFRMYSVERLLKGSPNPDLQHAFEQVRTELEAAGFHTRSHAAPNAPNASS